MITYLAVFVVNTPLVATLVFVFVIKKYSKTCTGKYQIHALKYIQIDLTF